VSDEVGRPLEIAMISYYLPSGSKIGVGHQVHLLANAMVDRGHRVTVFSGCEASEGARYTTETVGLSGSNRTFRFALRLRHVDWSEFDVLHAHGDDYWLWRRRVPVHVRTIHGSCFSEAIHISGAKERLRMALLGLTELLATVVADEAVVVSENSRRWMPWVRRVIPNGVDLTRFRPGQRSENPSILFVGTYGRRKRGKLLVDVFEREVIPRLPNAELWLVAEDAPPRRGVTVFGRIPDEELASLYGRAWLFCLPSSYEGFGIPYVEAMAAGCPVVATRNPGAVEITRNGRHGLLVDDADLGASLVWMLTSPGDRMRFAQEGLRRATDFDVRRIAHEYEALFADVANTSDHNDSVDGGVGSLLVDG
jgi:phosphatidyl-myo-inositol alpha-mannosyltransferase